MDTVGYDYTNVTADAVGAEHGLTDKELSGALKKHGGLPEKLEEVRAAGGADYMNLPADTELADAVAEFADGARGEFENFVVAGIGGSSLGGRALFEALCHPFHNLLPAGKRGGPRMFFPDNVDPELLTGLMDALEPAKTLVNVITKSGSTAETMAAFLILADWLRRAGGDYPSRVVATTDPQKGALRKLSREEKFASFPVPPGVGGRFSVLSAVGLVPCAFAGIDIHKLLAGAAEMDRRIRESAPEENPALVAAVVHTELDRAKGKHNAVFMPYAQCLRATADWFRQLWAESLGKKLSTSGDVVHTGQTPIAALGTTDQHSQIQLYAEGPNDKLVTFVEAGKFRDEVRMPDLYAGESAVGYLTDRTLNELMVAELAGTRIALTEANRPNATIVMPAINEETMGQLLYTLEVQTSYAGMILNVNPYDQPGVEAGKVAAFALMGREGYEDRLAQIKAGEASKRRIV